MSLSALAAALSHPQIRALNALSKGATVTDAAEAAGVNRCTVHTWCRGHEVFRSFLDESKRMQAEIVLDHFRGLVDSAAAALRQILADPDTAPGIRLKAALAVMNTVTAASKQEDTKMFYLDEAQAAGLIPAASAEPAPPSEPAPGTEAEATPARQDATIASSSLTACLCGSGKKHWVCCGLDPMVLPLPRAA